MSSPFLLLFGTDQSMFESCFGTANLWSCDFRQLGNDCSLDKLSKVLKDEGLLAVVFEDLLLQGGDHFTLLRGYYEQGGMILYFGVDGEFAAPDALSRTLSLQWKFSAYTAHEYLLTPLGKHYLGKAVPHQPYTKCNLLAVPEEDRLMVPKIPWDSFEQYTEDEGGTLEQYNDYKERLQRQCPLAMHRNARGGRIVYLGFVNGDGNIPKFVRALCTNTNIQV